MSVQTLPAPPKKATLADLYQAEGKAELVNGRILNLMATGDEPGYAADEIFVALRGYARRINKGKATADNRGFIVDLPNRKSFSPDAAYYTGPPGGHGFYPQPPDFAVEVRSENDYTTYALRAQQQKRDDYFAAGTLVVWDVALLQDEVVRVFRAPISDTPAAVYRKGDTAEAEPAVPGWTMPVDDLFE